MGARAFRPPKRRHTGRALLTAEVMTVEAALADPALEGGTLAALVAASLSRPGGRMSECAVCLEPWGPGRGPCRVMAVHLRGVANIGFVCPACAAGTDGGGAGPGARAGAGRRAGPARGHLGARGREGLSGNSEALRNINNITLEAACPLTQKARAEENRSRRRYG